MKLLLENWRLYSAIGATLMVPIIMMSAGDLGNITTKDGEAIYKACCANCHGADGKGNGMAANFVEDIKRMEKSDEELLSSIRNGFAGKLGYMPGWVNTLTENQMTQVLKYIRQTFQTGVTQ